MQLFSMSSHVVTDKAGFKYGDKGEIMCNMKKVFICDTHIELYSVEEHQLLFCVTDEEMDAGCEKRLVSQITKQVSAVLARPNASNDDKKKAYEQLLGIRWSKPLIKEVSPHMLSGLVRRGLYNRRGDGRRMRKTFGLTGNQTGVGSVSPPKRIER